jgi:putative AdoMet-dependent methyltransferase
LASEPLDSSRELFARWAVRYDASVRECDSRGEFPFAGYARVLSRVAELTALAVRTTVLELGAGTGNLTRELAASGASVVGVDQSEPMLDIAREKVPAARLVRLDLRSRESLSELGKFDRIVGAYALHELPQGDGCDHLTWLAESLLNPGGRCVFGDIWFADDNSRDAARVRWERLWDPTEHYWAMDEMVPALRARGLAADWERVSECAGVLTLAR